MAYTAIVNSHDIPTCERGTFLPAIPDEDQCLDCAEQDYEDKLLNI